MVLKECYYIENYENNRSVYYGFSWYLPDITTDSPACKCIMAVAEGESVPMDRLNELQTSGIISGLEYNAIRALDNQSGTIDDLKIIKKLAKKLKIKMVRK